MATNERVLVLLTNQFPIPSGDYAFLSSEIGGLSDAFDRVYIWSHATPEQDLVPLPANVTYMGTLGPAEPLTTGKVATARRVLRTLRPLILPELRAGVIRSKSQFDVAFNTAIRAVRGAERVEAGLKQHGLRLEDVYVYGFWGVHGGLPLALLGRRAKAAVVRVHRYDLYEEMTGYIPFRRGLFDSVDLVLPISDHGHSYLVGRYPSVAHKVVTQRLGTFDQGLGPDPQPGLSRIVSCSNVITLKRVPLIFETLKEAALTSPIEWVHFGDGADFAYLQSMIAEYDHPGLSVDLRGRVPNLSILEYYQTTPVTAFVNLSESEGVPVSIMEAMSYGIPIVATDVGGVAELLGVDGESGVLLPADPTAKEAAVEVLKVIEERSGFSPRQQWMDLANTTNLTSGLVDKMMGAETKKRRGARRLFKKTIHLPHA